MFHFDAIFFEKNNPFRFIDNLALKVFFQGKKLFIFTIFFSSFLETSFQRLEDYERLGGLDVRSIEILGAMYARRSMFEKRDNFFQLITTLFCEVKRGFVDR
jgi:hypothetical protein